MSAFKPEDWKKEEVAELFERAIPLGIRAIGIKAVCVRDRGISILASRDIMPGELVLRVPFSAMRTLDNTPAAVTELMPRGVSVRAILAISMSEDKTPFFKTWNSLLPHRNQYMPTQWPRSLRDRLPPTAAKLLNEQRQNLQDDWNSVRDVFGKQITFERFASFWILTNNRSFFQPTPATATRPPRDQIVLRPIVDLFNHAAYATCTVSVTSSGAFEVRTAQLHEAGDELLFCYGRHSNSVLLVEYGFVMPHNRWESMSVDNFVLKELTCDEMDLLEEYGYLGNYVLDTTGFCQRTQVALRLLVMKRERWIKYMVDREDDKDTQEMVNNFLTSKLTCKMLTAVNNFRSRAGGEEQRQWRDMRTAPIMDLWLEHRRLVEWARQRLLCVHATLPFNTMMF